MADEKNFEAYRDYYGVKECLHCGADMEGVNHHYLCNRCWCREKLSLACQEVDNAFRDVRGRPRDYYRIDFGWS